MIRSAQEFIDLRCSEDQDDYMRAVNEEVELSVMYDLVRNYPDMKVEVALNKLVPLEVLWELADDADYQVRWTVASKRKLSAELFEKLARDENPVIRKRIALNRKVPEQILRMLAGDPDGDVATSAKERLHGAGLH